MRRQFTVVLAAEWRGVLNDKWNPEQPLVVSHMALTRTLGDCKAREIGESIDHQLKFWERGIHAGLVGNALAEGRAREARVKRSEKEKYDGLACSFHITLLLGKLWQVVCWSTDQEEGRGVFYQRVSALTQGDRLRISHRTNTPTCV